MDKLKVYRVISGIGMILLAIIISSLSIFLFIFAEVNSGRIYIEAILIILIGIAIEIFLLITAIFIFKNKKWAKITALISYTAIILFYLFFMFFLHIPIWKSPVHLILVLLSSVIPLIFTIFELKGSKNIPNNQKMKGGKTK